MAMKTGKPPSGGSDPNKGGILSSPQLDGDTHAPLNPIAGRQKSAESAMLWTTVGYASSLSTRLVGNIVLARWLFPEAFGLMTLVRSILMGVQLVTDLGAGAMIIQHKYGTDSQFIRTVWTINVLRGVVLYGILALTAGLFASLFEAPRLTSLLLVGGIVIILRGLFSENLSLLTRHMNMRRLAEIEVAVQFGGLFAVLAIAYVWRDVWAMIWGLLISATIHLVLSHLVVGSPSMRFTLDRRYAHDILHFTKWIFLASASTFIVTRFDRLFMGKIFTLEDLGVYAIAAMFVQMPPEFARTISRRVVFPALAGSIKVGAEAYRLATLRTRVLLAAIVSPSCLALLIFGPEIVDLLFDERYQGAGPMIQILSVGVIGTVTFLPIGSVALATGDSRRHMLIVSSRAITTVVGLSVGAWLGGTSGALWGLSAAPYIHYPLLVRSVKSVGAWHPLLDATLLATTGLIGVLGLYLKAQWL